MTLKRLALTTGACLVALPSASAFAQTPPGNDHYLQSVPFNTSGQAGDPPPDAQELEHSVDTTVATEQADLFSPAGDGSPGGGGPPETLVCDGVAFGKTVWYDVYPNRNGNLRVLAVGTGFDPVIAIYRFEPRGGNPAPNLNEATCVNARTGPTEELIVPIVAGRAYTMQIGGVGSTGGPMQGTFGFFRTTAERLRADATLRATATPNGIRVAQLRVTAPRGARITVSCTRRGCRRQARNARAAAGTLADPIGPVSPATASAARKGSAAAADSPRANAARTRSFRNVRGRRLSAGSAIEIRVTRRGAIGTYIKYTVRRGNFRKTTRCMNPGSTRPRRRCSS